MIYFVIFLAIILVPVFLLVQIYNSLQRNKIKAEESWSGISTILQQRNDLIPNLVETVKGYAQHEKGTLEDVTKWRNQSISSKNTEEFSIAESGLHRSIGGIFAVAERYPDLKADQNFRDLQSQLSSLEEKLSAARNVYNGSARAFNTTLAVFPNNVVASFFNIGPVAFFNADEQANTVPKVKF